MSGQKLPVGMLDLLRRLFFWTVGAMTRSLHEALFYRRLNDTTANLLGAAGMELMRAAVTAAATAVDPRGVTPVGAAARAAVTEASNAAAESQVLQILKVRCRAAHRGALES